MRRYLTLISLLILSVAAANATNRHAKKKRVHSHREITHIAPPVITSSDNFSAYDLLYFAQDLLGTPYRSGSSDPSRGFDCSGFVSYVFKQFNFDVPRSSCEFINVGEKVNIEDARPGDIILFTGTKTHHPHSIGHVGIVYSNEGSGLTFIHSTSGKEHGVTITAMNDLYQRRFVQVIRLFKQNDEVSDASLTSASL